MRKPATFLLAAAGSVTLLALLAPSASALVAPPEWPTAGYKPTCDSTTFTPGGPTVTSTTFNDDTLPTVTSATVQHKIVIKQGVNVPWVINVRATDLCSGVGSAMAILAVNGTPVISSVLATYGPDAFHANLTSTPTSFGQSASAGIYSVSDLYVWDRYSSFTLGSDHKMVASSEVFRPHSSSDLAGYWAGPNPTTYVVTGTFLTDTVSKTKVKKNAVITVAGKLLIWNRVSTTNTPQAGASVELWSKVGKAKWSKIGTKVTAADGKVSFSTKVKATTTYQLRYSPALATLIDSSASAASTVTAK